MTHQCENRGLLASRISLFMVAVICHHTGSTKGNSVEELKEPSGQFESPGYPYLSDGEHCTWNIIVPLPHKIRITFLDFDLLNNLICEDKLEIHEGNVKTSTHSGIKLHQKSITSTSNTMSVVLISCSTIFWTNRRGIAVTYSTVYPTTLTHETSRRVTTTRRTTTTTTTIERTSKEIFIPQRNPVLSAVFTSTLIDVTSTTTATELPEPPSSGNNSKQASTENSGNIVPFLLAGLLVVTLILIAIAIIIVKRRKAEYLSNASSSSTGNSEANHGQDNFSTVVTDRTGEDDYNLEYDYVQGTEIQTKGNENVCLDKNGVKFSARMIAPRIQKKHPVFSASNALCEYENNASGIYDNTNFDEDYSTVICTVQQASSRVYTNDKQMQPHDSDVVLDEGTVINTAYEPYRPQT